MDNGKLSTLSSYGQDSRIATSLRGTSVGHVAPGMSVGWELITPEIAKQLLRTVKNNRPVGTARVRDYANMMRNGKWRENSQTIAIGTDGCLVDGQHRLHAIVESKQTIRLLVVRNLPNESLSSLDTGQSRSGPQILSIEGYANGKHLAPITNLVAWYYERRPSGQQAISGYPTSAILDLVLRYPRVQECAEWVRVLSDDCRHFVAPRIVGACYYIFSEINKEQAEDFLTRTLRGVELNEGAGSYWLMRRLRDQSTQKAKLSATEVFALFIKAWNADRLGRPVKFLKWTSAGDRTEAFPVAI